jgi:heterodisulfide reductase subunit B
MELHKEKCTKKQKTKQTTKTNKTKQNKTKQKPPEISMTSCHFCGLQPVGRVMSAGADSCGVLRRQTHMVRHDLC